jgi:hypothetical protein
VPLIVIIALAASLLMVAALAIDAARAERPVYCATLAAARSPDSPLVYIGATQSVYFFRRARTNETEVIQRKEVVRLTQLLSHRERCAETPAVSSGSTSFRTATGGRGRPAVY